MNYSKSILFVFGFFLIGSLVISDSYSATTIELLESESSEDFTCESITTTGSKGNVTGVDGATDFIEDEDYLIVATASWGGAGTSDAYSIKLQIGNVTFAGSENINEPETSGNCGNNESFYNYFYSTVFTPNSTEAVDNIIMNFTSLDGSQLFVDDVVISVVHLNNTIIEKDEDWFFFEDATDSTLGTSWNTPNNATLTFTPTFNNNDWLIIGSNQIDTGTATTNYESRLFSVNQTDSGFPVISQEGEDPIDEIFLHTMMRVYNLSNTQSHNFQVQAQKDDSGGGTEERIHTQIFALNLNRFTDHDFFWDADILSLSETPYATEISDASITPIVNQTNVMIIVDTGTKDADGGDHVHIRVQNDNSDIYPDTTTQQYGYNGEYDLDDILRIGQNKIENMDNSTHSIDVDASGTTDDTDVLYRSIGVFTLRVNPPPELFTINATDTTSPISMIDNATFRIDRLFNDTNPISMVDDPTFNIFDNVIGNPISMIDNATLSVNFFGNFTVGNPISMIDNATFTIVRVINATTDNPISMIDNATLTVNRIFNDTNPISMIDNATLSVNFFGNFTVGNPISMIDDPTLTVNFFGNFTVGNPISMIDDPTLTVNRMFNDTNPISMIDDPTLTVNFFGNFTDNPISMIDDPTFDIFDNVIGNPISMIDNATLSVNFFGNFTDGNPISMIDNVTLSIARLFNDTNPISMIDNATYNIFDNVIGNPISMIDNATFNIFDNVIGNPISMIDNATLSVNFFGNFTVGNPISMIDNATFTLVRVINATTDNPISMIDNATFTLMRVFNDTNPISMIDDPTFNIFDNVFGNPMSMTDSIQFQIKFLVTPPIVIPPSGGGGSVGGQPVSNLIDTDGDGILDDVDDCPLERETFNGFADEDGCPDDIDPPVPVSIADLGFPFGFNELSVIDDFVNLETDSPQPQVEDLGIRWLGDEPITITSITVQDSPFEFQFENLPAEFGNNQIGFTQGQIIYTLQEPNKVCTNVFSFDCVDDVTYEIPVVIQGEVRGKTVIAQGSIIVDNSDRFNPYWLVFVLMVAIIIFAFVIWKRRRKAPQKTRTLLKVTQAKRTKVLTEVKRKPTGKGQTRRILDNKQKKKFLRSNK